jgi:hypothetical protein
LLRKEIKEVWWVGEDLWKNSEKRVETLRSEEGMKEEQ